MPAITPLPTPPSTNDPTNFASEADAFLGALPDFGAELNEFAENINNLSTSATSTTSNTVGTGSKAFTVETGKGFVPGQSLTIARTAAPSNRMFTVVDTYNSGTGALVVTSQAFEGSGTFTDWTISLGFNGQISSNQLANGVVNDQTLATFDPMQDTALIADASDSGNKKKAKLGAPKGYISGFLVTNNVSDANNDLDISAGYCRNADNTLDVVLAASITKRMDAAFVAGTGNGGLGNAVSKPTSGTFHVFVIYNTTTFAVDVYGDTSVSGANVPSGWAIGRRIASYRTDSSANFIAVKPVERGGGEVWVPYDVQRSGDIADTSVSSAARETYALTVPVDIRVLAKFTAQLLNPDSNGGLKFFDLATADATVSLDTGTMSLGGSVASGSAITGVRYAGEFEVMTNTSGQIGARSIATGTDLYANTIGYTDFRR
jgi:hypothetical protein